jgi:eukaryotic-like serine/threonine-protein kinase
VPADGGIRFGNYVLLRRIARGGMAEVFLAQQRGLEGFDRRVAVKRILPHLADSPEFVKMFLGEAKLAAQLTHPNIVHIYDFGKVDHDYFIAMEYVEGVHAGQLFKQDERDRMSPTLIARVGADAAAALHYAHELLGPTGQPFGLVHRDVSPANLMISYDGVVKLCDFGIAKAAALTDQRTNPGQVKGKYAYMSPEQTVAASLDGRSDVFSLAIVLWELLAGKTIVPRGDPIAAMRAIRDGKLQPIAQAVPGIAAPLADAITWALETRREDRATAAGLATALEGFIKGSPELATPMQVSAWVRAQFPREALTGPQQAISDDPAAGPSTLAVPGTVGGTGGTATGGRLIPVTPLGPRAGAEEAAPRVRLVGRGAPAHTPAPAGPTPAPPARTRDRAEDADDLTETIAMLGDPDAGTETLIVERRARSISKRITARQPAAGDQDATLIEDPSRRVLIEPPPLDRPSVIIHETLHQPREVTTQRSEPRHFVPAPSSQPQPLLPSRGQSYSGERNAPVATGAETIGRARPPRRLALFGGLAGIAVASFLVALVVCSPQREAAAPDAPTIAAEIADASPPPDSAAPTFAEDAAPAPDAGEPTPDAPIRMQLYKVDTRPPGGTVQIGDDRRVAPADFQLPPGKHTIVAELDGWQSETRPIEITEGVDLTHEIPFTRRAHTTRATQTGTLTVRTTPYSDVYIGTRKIGQSPFADKEVPAGTYWLTFKSPLHPTVKKQVTILPGKLFKLPPFNLPPPE